MQLTRDAAALAGKRPQQELDAAAPPSATVIRPATGWQAINIRELWQFRELLYFLVWRDVKVRYKQTVLGAAWAILQPALLMVVFTIFFGRLAKLPAGNVPYPLFAYLGVLPWTLFSTGISNAGNSVVGSERLITKIYFPRLAIPFASVGAATVDFAMAFILLLGMMLFYGVMPGWEMLLIPLLLSLNLLTALGVGTLLAALNVAYRDFRYVIGFLVQIWMFATPTIYMQTSAGKGGIVHVLLNLNPMTPLIAAFRAACLNTPLDWKQVGMSASAALAVFLLGCLYFRRVERSFADII